MTDAPRSLQTVPADDGDQTSGRTIAFNQPGPVGREMEHVTAAVAASHLSATGSFTRRVSDLLADVHSAPDVVLTTSCTDALEMAALLLDLEPGDVVIVPSFTFVSTALAFARAGATIRFADIESETLGLDPGSVSELIDDRVKAVVPVHYGGVGCDIEGIATAIAGTGIEIVEDNAHGLFGTIGDRTLGTFGRMSTISFHETKNFHCGEGGALVLNDGDDVERAHVLLHKGTNRRSFERGDVGRYTWVDTGSSFGLSDLLAGYLLGQLDERDSVLARRSRVWGWYHEGLADLSARHDVRRMHVPDDRGCAWHLYYLLVPEADHRSALIEHLAAAGVQATFHYVPLHSSPGGRAVSDVDATLPVTDDVAARLVRLPFHNHLAHGDVELVVEAIESFYG